MEFSTKSREELSKLLEKYPDKRSCLLPTLYIAQKEFGWISPEMMEYVSKELDIPVMQVYETATFYTMFNKKPVGKYHIQVCTNISCSLLDARSEERRGRERVCHRV